MANIRKIAGVTGLAYKITVTAGRDLSGKQIRHYKTYTPPEGYSEKRAEKAAQAAAAQFELEIRQGYQLDNRQTFAEYAQYVIDLKEANGAKHNTVRSYRDFMRRIVPAIGSYKLCDIRPQHLNAFYKQLQAPNSRLGGAKAIGKGNLPEKLNKAHMTRESLAEAAHTSPTTITLACRGETISYQKAADIAAVLQAKPQALFTVIKDSKPLSNKTVLEYHRFIHTVLEQAEKEMLVPYNAAAKATPPKVMRHDVNYFQPEQITAILDALEEEPIKWRTITHLLIVTGCRRGEIMGLKWEKVNLDSARIEISTNLCYSKERGIYETTPKTGNNRFINIPKETADVLKKYRASQTELRIMNGDRWIETGYLFTQDNGEPMNPTSITAWLSEFSRRTGLPHINPHAFRHSVASILISAGTDIVTVSKQLGHSQVSTTGDIYSHVIEEAKAQATETIANIMLRSKNA